jgi:selenocysteine-specific elongation factor
VLFVVAADESIKPQTREHFEICRLLGVKAGVVAITRADLVDPEIVDLVKLEVEEFVLGSFLESAPQIAVSSVTGAGIPELLRALEQTARTVAVKPADGWFRMPVDRAFTMRGFGTVVTGTMTGGQLRREAQAELYPTGRVLRVRGVQVHGEAAEVASAGQRTAVNLADIEPGDIVRGMVLSEAGRFRAVTVFDSRFELLAGARPLKNRAPVHLHAGSAAVEAEVRLLEKCAAVGPGENAWVRFVLREPVLVLPGDRFIVRSFSPVVTIGGGEVLDVSGFRYRGSAGVAARLEKLAGGDGKAMVELLITETPHGIERSTLIALTGLRELPVLGAVEATGEWLIGKERAACLRAEMVETVGAFHKANSLLPGMPRQELKSRVVAEASVEIFEYLLASAAALVAEEAFVRLRGHNLAFREDEARARTAIVNAFAGAGLAAPAVAEVVRNAGIDAKRARTMLQLLLREGTLVMITEDLILHRDAMGRLRETLALKQGQRFGVAEFKEWTGVSRKYAIPLLEYLDRAKVTRRDGEARIVTVR